MMNTIASNRKKEELKNIVFLDLCSGDNLSALANFIPEHLSYVTCFNVIRLHHQSCLLTGEVIKSDRYSRLICWLFYILHSHNNNKDFDNIYDHPRKFNRQHQDGRQHHQDSRFDSRYDNRFDRLVLFWFTRNKSFHFEGGNIFIYRPLIKFFFSARCVGEVVLS